MKLFESDKTLAFLDISPLSRGHSVRLPLYNHVSQFLITSNELEALTELDEC